jgi:hypothetical protein
MKRELPQKYVIHRTEKFIEQSHALEQKYSRIPELIKAIDWALERRPHYFNHISSNYYFWVTEDLTEYGFPEVRIMYMIKEEDYIVLLIDIEEN